MRAEIVVNTILKKAQEDGLSLTHLQIQKLMYFIHGRYLAQTHRPLIDANFEVWPYGPVVRHIYNELSVFGANPVTAFLPIIDKNTNEKKYFLANENDTEFWEAFNYVWDKYSHFDAFSLSSLSHKKGSPWDTTQYIYDQIPNDKIRDYFGSENGF